jgi:sugar lactone lactonase YvrE
MKFAVPSLLGLALLVSCSTPTKDKKLTTNLPTEQKSELTKVTSFKGMQVTGITVSDNGRMFVNFPRWRQNVPFSVVEVMQDGSFQPYPDKQWNKWGGKPEKNKFTCVQSVFAHRNSLFVLDPASPFMEGVKGNAMLYEFDLTTNDLKRSWTFNKQVAPKKSYLNDLRVDETHKKIYITDSGLGGIVIVDLNNNSVRRVLDNHASVKSEGILLRVNGKKFLVKGKKPDMHSDGIALAPDDSRLYFHALSGYNLYNIQTEALHTESLTPEELAAKVVTVGVTPAPDGMIFDDKGNLFMADLERNAVVYKTPGGEIKILIQDERIQWPDTFTIDRSSNSLLFTDSLLNKAGIRSAVDKMNFPVYKVALP